MWRLRWLALILCAVFAAAVVLSIGLGVVYAGHHCAGGHCEVCIAYWGAQSAMRILGLAAILRALTLPRPLAQSGRPSSRAPAFAALSLVSLNVRMNN